MTGSARYYFHKDHLGSSTAMTDANGAKIETTEYVPYGEMRDHQGTEVTNYKFTDQELDPETGLYNYGARLYDPIIGRFITPDTMIPDVYDPQMLNRYSYCRNNPLIYTDPTGHMYGDAEADGGWEGADYGGDPDGGDSSDGGNSDASGAGMPEGFIGDPKQTEPAEPIGLLDYEFDPMPELPEPPRTPDFTNPAPLRNTEESSYISYMYNRLPFKETPKAPTLSENTETLVKIITFIVMPKNPLSLSLFALGNIAVEIAKGIERAKEAANQRKELMRDYCPACGPNNVNYDKQLEKQYEKRLE